MATTVEQSELLTARARVYDLLSAVFDGDVTVLANAMEDDAFGRIAATLPVELDTDPLSTDDADRERLKYGYDNLFAVPGPHYVPPMASAHRTDPSADFESDSPYHEEGQAGELLGDPAATMAGLYARVGFEPTRGDGMPDHLAAELEFMHALCEREAKLRQEDGDPAGIEALRDLQREVLETLGWLDAFDAAVADRDAVEGTFAALTRLARTFVAWDARDGVATDAESETQ